jgi:hypothetical protein
MPTLQPSPVETARPKVSFGIPVRNGMPGLRSTIDSILSQDCRDLEVVVCDNGSTDGTLAYLRELSARDPRVKLYCNESNIGQNLNFNRVFEMSRGEYFRWIGVDDVVHAGYVGRCVDVLDSQPGVVAVSADTRYVDDAGQVLFNPYHGERVESREPQRRFARTLWFLMEDYRYFDPMYNMVRRSMLERTQCLRPVPFPDQNLAAQTSLLGPVAHIPECLSTRQREPRYFRDTASLGAKYYPPDPGAVFGGAWETAWHFGLVALRGPLAVPQKLSCLASALGYALRRRRAEIPRELRSQAKQLLRALQRGRPMPG